jgi:4-amino-4-deoxy-L-arabinose transferase-like glycosyltransferase
MTLRTWWAILALLIVVTLVRVATTHRVFSQTVDEPWHLVAGYDFLTKWKFTSDLHHPPLARVFFALPFVGTPEPPAGTTRDRGNTLLLRNDRYTQNVARARLGNLLFVALALLAVALWARHLISPAAGLVAALLLASLPPVLAHSGVATTDMAITALLALALFSFSLFLERPTWKRTLLFGFLLACGLLSKYSFLMYFPPAALVLIVLRRRLPSPRLAVAGVVGFLLVWGAYGFAFGTIRDADERGPGYAQEIFGTSRIATVPLPAPLYLMGVLEVKDHDIKGHPAILFGEMRQGGWWYYFPVALFYKTPIPFLLLALAGCVLMLVRRKAIEIVVIVAVILDMAMTSRINIGVRHVLPIYAPLSIAAAFAVVNLWRFRFMTGALAAWLIIGSAAAHPDYLPWFNAFAGDRPEKILTDSNIDWGQDVLRLVRYTRREKIPHLTLSLSTSVPVERVGLPPITYMELWKPLHGWVAISEFHLAIGHADPQYRAWTDEWFPEQRPFTRIGKSIRLYHFN